MRIKQLLALGAALAAGLACLKKGMEELPHEADRAATPAPEEAAAVPADSVTVLADAGRQADVLEKYRKQGSVRQLALVEYLGGSSAELYYYLKDAEADGGWHLAFETDAHCGRNGVGKQREGDWKTPLGDFGVTTAFGVYPNPGTALNYIPITDSVYCCDEDTEYYNRILDLSGTGHQCTGEHMIDIVPYYNYGIALDYNRENIYPLGSAIFLHCKGKNPWTAGCIAIDEERMKEILCTADGNMRIVIYSV